RDWLEAEQVTCGVFAMRMSNAAVSDSGAVNDMSWHALVFFRIQTAGEGMDARRPTDRCQLRRPRESDQRRVVYVGGFPSGTAMSRPRSQPMSQLLAIVAEGGV